MKNLDWEINGDQNRADESPVREAVAKAIDVMREKIAAGELKPTVAEFIKLLELQKELNREAIREVKVTWLDLDSETEPY